MTSGATGTAQEAAGDSDENGPETLCQLVRETHRSLNRVLQVRLGRYGVSLGQWVFLRALWQEDGITQRELSQRVGMMEPTTVTALNGMERQGLVERVRNRHDRRKINIFLTPKAQGLRDQVLPGAREVTVAAVAGLSMADVARMAETLRTMVANLSASAPATAAEGDQAPELHNALSLNTEGLTQVGAA